MAVKTNKEYNSILKQINKKFKNKDFEFVLSNLTLEEIVQAKLELSSRSLNEKLFGYPLYNNIQNIVKESLVKFAFNFCDTKERAYSILGLNKAQLIRYMKKNKFYNEVNDES